MRPLLLLVVVIQYTAATGSADPFHDDGSLESRVVALYDSLDIQKPHFCLGTVLTKFHIVTGCCRSINNTLVRAGIGNGRRSQAIKVDRVIRHPLHIPHAPETLLQDIFRLQGQTYHKGPESNTVCLLVLSTGLDLTDEVRAATLPSKEPKSTAAVAFRVTDWGKANIMLLRSVLTVESCDKPPARIICAQANPFVRAPCFWDFGGPLFVDGELHGIAVDGDCFTKVEFISILDNRYRPWIEQEINQTWPSVVSFPDHHDFYEPTKTAPVQLSPGGTTAALVLSVLAIVGLCLIGGFIVWHRPDIVQRFRSLIEKA